MATIEILYFARVRERIGRDGETIEVPAGVVDVAGLIGWLAARGGGEGAALGDLAALRFAIDQEFVAADAPIAGARELAVFPPVTGG